jgi:ferredoxin
MPTITVDGAGSFEVASGTKLVLALEDNGVDLLHRCGGNARCTTCRVEILAGDPGPMSEAEAARLAQEQELAPNIRLSCQIRVESDLTVKALRLSSVEGIPAGTRPAD